MTVCLIFYSLYFYLQNIKQNKVPKSKLNYAMHIDSEYCQGLRFLVSIKPATSKVDSVPSLDF